MPQWGDAREIQIDGRELRISNPDRPLFPDGFTKAHLVSYYLDVAAALLPHLAERPVTLRRFPEGVWAHGWFQTECRNNPTWVPTQDVGFESAPPQRYCVINERAGLAWAANLAAVELHPLLARRDRLDHPLVAVVDLDPGEPAGLRECCAVALLAREALAADDLVAYPKTSGSAGLHLYVPLNDGQTFRDTKGYVRALAASLAEERADLVVDVAKRSVRTDKVFIDWVQNHASRSTAAPYTIRAARSPAVSAPLRWEEVEAVAAGADPRALQFGPRDVLERLERDGDLFAPTLRDVQRVPAIPAV